MQRSEAVVIEKLQSIVLDALDPVRSTNVLHSLTMASAASSPASTLSPASVVPVLPPSVVPPLDELLLEHALTRARATATAAKETSKDEPRFVTMARRMLGSVARPGPVE